MSPFAPRKSATFAERKATIRHLLICRYLMHAEIIAIGDEITSGQLLDTNSQWLSLRLEELGIRVLYHTTIGDELEPIAEVFRQALARSDLIVATGGLGPTADDLTRDALTRAAGRRLVLDSASLDYIRGLFARASGKCPGRTRSRQCFPKGAAWFPIPTGPRRALIWTFRGRPRPRHGSSACPACPRKCGKCGIKPYWERCAGWGPAGGRSGSGGSSALGPARARSKRNCRTSSAAGGRLASASTPARPRSSCGSPRTARTAEECYAAMQPTAATIYETLGNLVYGEEEDEIQDAVVKLLRQRKQTLATVEWGTAGLVADWLGVTACGDAVYRGGVIVSSETALERTLDVPSCRTALHDPSSNSEVFAAAATACRDRFAADYGLAIGPFPSVIPGSVEPELVYIALAGPGGPAVKALPFAGHPDLLRTLFAKHALNIVRLALQ